VVIRYVPATKDNDTPVSVNVPAVVDPATKSAALLLCVIFPPILDARMLPAPVIVGEVRVLFVSVSVVAFPIRVSVPVGSVKTPDPAADGAAMLMAPETSPDILTLAILCYLLWILILSDLYLSFPSIKTTVKDGV
jgi:hypothetical protein